MSSGRVTQSVSSFFSRDLDGVLVPGPLAISPWSQHQVGGYAVCGVLARAIEHAADVDAFVPVRLTVDLCAPVAAAGLVAEAAEVRRGPRIQLLDAMVGRDGDVAARARAVFAAPGDFAEHQNAERKAIWQRFPPLVAGEETSPFVRAAVMAVTTSLVCHWGSAGAGFINIDTTLALNRLPRGAGLGLRADDQRSQDGISVGTATMFDRHGYLGACTVTAIANARRQLDLGAR